MRAKLYLAGGWTLWTSWSSCTLTCGWGNTQRYRDCTNPTPSPYGQPCRGPSVDIESCHTDECILGTCIHISNVQVVFILLLCTK